MADLKTNYVDDVLETTKNQLRKYQQIQNDDGTVSFVDVTEYAQVGTSFGAKDINDTNAAINDVNRKLSGKLEIELLWENPNTGVDFEAQEIELPTLNKYSFYFIIFSGSTYGGGKTEGINTGFIPIDRATELMYIGSYLRWRGVTRSDKGIRIGQGNMVQAYGTSTKENSVCIPAEIYGVK
jgi:hypothetical protein|nr:MAG TPA: hypothetical protein [Bacteriophage sp.]